MPHLDHIGIAVMDSGPLVKVLHDLFRWAPYKEEAVEADRVKTYFIAAGGAKVEIVEPLDASSVLNRFLERRGGGLHHLAFEVDDVDAAMEHARSLGYNPLDDEARSGADGKRIFFLHPRQTAGVLIEICQTARSTLRPQSDFPAATVRTAGSPANPRLAYLYEGDPELSQPALAASLEQQFHFESVRVNRETDDKIDWPAENPEAPVHIALEGDLVFDLVSHSRRIQVDPASMILVNPSDPGDLASIAETPSKMPVLALAIGEGAVQAAIRWHELIPGSRFAALPDAELAPRLIARHALHRRGAKGLAE